MRTGLVVIAAALVLFLSGAAYDLYLEKPPPAPKKSRTENPAMPHETVPDFQVTDLHGAPLAIADLRGTPVILSFWASWCAPCVEEFPALLGYVRAQKGGAVLLALSSDNGEDAVHRFLGTLPTALRAVADGPSVRIALDPGRTITREVFQTELYPETLFIGADGRMIHKTAGFTDWDVMPPATPDWSGGLP